jgi:hypothetical protein
MSAGNFAETINHSGPLLLAGAILSSSFFGSWHCGAMCGPMVSLMRARNSLTAYHLGRALSYISLGAAAGAVGSFFLTNEFQVVRVFAASILAVSLAIMGLRLLLPRYRTLLALSPVWAHGVVGTLSKNLGAGKSAFVLGLLSALLPCGWLYTYVIAAAATKSPIAGAITLALFWLGGLPILLALPSMLKSGIAAAGLQQQRIAGAILVLCSVYSLAVFYLG